MNSVSGQAYHEVRHGVLLPVELTSFFLFVGSRFLFSKSQFTVSFKEMTLMEDNPIPFGVDLNGKEDVAENDSTHAKKTITVLSWCI